MESSRSEGNDKQNLPPAAGAPQSGKLHCAAALGLTFILRRELLHFRGQGLIEALFSGNEGLANSVVIVAHHAAVAAHLVNERLQQDPSLSGSTGIFAILAHFHGLTNTHCVRHQLHTWGMGRAAWAGRGQLHERQTATAEKSQELVLF